MSPRMANFSQAWTIVGLLALSSSVAVLGALDPISASKQHSKLAKLFDYEGYKRTFGKSYSSELENSTRKCYFYARALDAFVSGVSYKYRNADYYKALNEMSDWTPKERAMTFSRRQKGHFPRLDKPLAFMPARGENPEETLRKFLEEHVDDDPIYRDLLDQLDQPIGSTATGAIRRKRSIDASRGPRDFSFGKLINSDGGETPGGRRRSARVRSNNPKYKGIELMTRGLSDQLEEVDLVYLKPSEGQQGPLEERLETSLSWLESASKKTPGKGRSSSKPKSATDLASKDEIFFDHRNSGCLSEIRRQGKCGCCYAFASIAMAEWLYCKNAGRLVAFSEQYMLDCGKGRIEGMRGCKQGTDQATVEFIHNFGLELQSNYPYMAREGTCPYDEGTDLSTTGYIRMPLGGFIEIPMSVWPKAIQLTPLYIIVDTDDSFLDYGGGVYDGSRCKKLTGDEDDLEPVGEYHAMVLVGHGREDGQEYWLIRNSHGPHWGDHGYYKLSKDAPSCVPRQVAYAFGTGKLRPRKNRLYDQAVVAARSKQRSKNKKREYRY